MSPRMYVKEAIATVEDLLIEDGEAVAAGILRVGKEDSQTNLSDLLTKIIKGQRRWDLCWYIFR